MRKYLIVIIVLLINLSVALAYNKIGDFTKANEHYKNEEYQEAIEIYESLINDGFQQFEVYYNLGNSYFRTSDYSKAIINFERAKRIEPSNEDVNYNLRIANLRIVDKFDTVPKIFFVQWYEFLLNLFNSCIWAWLIIIFFWLFIISITLFRLSSSAQFRKSTFLIGNTILVLMIISVVLSFNTFTRENSKKEAIIDTPSVYIKSAPEQTSMDMFVLHEGTKIRILDSVGDWYEIKIENGNVGWINKNDITII